MASTYWLISVPAELNKKAVFDKTTALTASFGSPCFKLDIPKLKVGTLDSLMVLSDEIAKFDTYADMAFSRIVRAWDNDIADSESGTAADLKIDMGSHSGGGEVVPEKAVENFTWAEERFPVKTNLQELTSTVYGQICDIDEEVKTALANFAQIKNSLNAIKRKAGGNLLVKDLNGIIESKHYCIKPDGQPSEKIIPVFIVVSKQRWDDFTNSYEGMTREVVPSSCKLINEDDSYNLVRVLHLDCPSLQTFKEELSKNKFTVRDFVYNAQAVEDGEEEKKQLMEQEKQARIQARKTLNTAFSEVFLLHLHLKAIRVFIESALWYSLPLNFQAMAIKVNPRKEAKLLEALELQFANAKGSAPSGGEGEELGKEERQYVSLTFQIDLEK